MKTILFTISHSSKDITVEDEGFVLSKIGITLFSRDLLGQREVQWMISLLLDPKNEDEESGKPNYAPSENGSTGYPSPCFGVLDVSPRAEDSPSAWSTNSARKFGDDTSWRAAFDMSNDTDSVSDFNTKESEVEMQEYSSNSEKKKVRNDGLLSIGGLRR